MLHRQVIGVNHITGLLILFSHVCAKAQLASFPGGLFCAPVADVCEKECVLHRLPVMVSHPGQSESYRQHYVSTIFFRCDIPPGCKITDYGLQRIAMFRKFIVTLYRCISKTVRFTNWFISVPLILCSASC